MRSQLLIALAAFSASAMGAAISSNKQGFTIDQVDTGRRILKNGAADVARTHIKYGKEPPSQVVAAADRAAVQSGSVSASPEAYNKAYLSPVQIGTPAQTVYLDFDTGSSDLWVFSNYTPSSQRSGHHIYSPGLSSTASYTGKTWAVQYGDGSSSSGVVWADKVAIGGATVTGQSVEAATSVAASFAQDPATDGLVGLAFDRLNTCKPSQCNTFVQNAAPSFPSPLFAAYLKRGTAGAYDFGFINSARYTGSIYYEPVTKKTTYGYWTVQGTGYAVNGGSKQSLTYDTIVDTGTSLIYLPDAAVNAYYAQVSGAQNSGTYGGWVFPCTATLPSITVYLSQFGITVAGSRLNYAPVSSSTCFGAVQSSSGIGISILGDALINNFYVVFNYGSEAGSSTVGFALQA